MSKGEKDSTPPERAKNEKKKMTCPSSGKKKLFFSAVRTIYSPIRAILVAHDSC
jgi:hypothetical protein